MTSTIAKVLRRTIYLLLLLLGILVIIGSIFISQLDLDDYRHELEQELSSALEQPVQIGRSKLTFNKGIALRFRDLKIGPPKALLADVPGLTATLKIGPLFEGRILLDRVEVDSPTLQVWLPIRNRPERGTTHQLTDKLGIRTLTVRDAKLKVHQRQGKGSHELLSLEGLHTELSGWQPNKTAKLFISGELQQPGQPAEFLLDFSLPSSPDPAVWRNEKLIYRLRVENLATSPQRSTRGTGSTNHVDLDATIEGIPAQGAAITAVLDTTSGHRELFNLKGTWSSSAQQETLSDLTGNLFGLPLHGEFLLLRQEKSHLLAGRFGAKDLPLTRQLLDQWQIPGTEKLLEGSLERLALIIEKTWQAGQPLNSLPRIGAEITISDLEWQGNSIWQLQDFTADLSLENQNLSIQDGLLVAGEQPIFFSGSVENVLHEPHLDLDIALEPHLRTLLPQDDLPKNWQMSGSVPTTLKFGGPIQQPGFLLQADLGNSNLNLKPFFLKKADRKSTLLLEGMLDAEMVQLDRLELQLPGLSISGDGAFSHDPSSDYFLLDIDPINLAKLQPLSPLLKNLRAQGALHPTLERSEKELKSSLKLVNVGVHLNNIVGDLNRANGIINIDGQGLRFENLKASFGKSAFILNGIIDDWHKPQLDLELQSSKVRAQDLIFPNQELHLYDLAGRLQVDGQGINFNPVKVRLEEATEVVVTGKLDNFKTPQVTLDISAEKANIDQVIALFVGPRKNPKPKKKVEHKPLTISARVKEGTIGDLRFQNAEGLIKDHRDVFTIYPLRFQSDKGFCLARIELDRTQPESILKISGHAEDLNASVLHQDLFKKRGLISGSLRGDFYLEGSLADGRFWHNAVGGIYMQVNDGTLRKFRGLAKVFSILNVSQLFTGNLPDMDREGMPFTSLEGSIEIANGRAKTEDLRLKSVAMNMSLIGSQSLIEDSVNYNLGVMPLRTVDKVITAIPIAGWVLAGENKALLTAHFRIEGSSEAPKVNVIPIDTVSDTVFGIFKRTLGLPGKLVKDIGSIFKQQPKKKEESAN